MGQLEIISRLCEVNSLLSDIVRKQQEVIEQSEIVDLIAKQGLQKEIEKAEQDLDIVEYKLRHIE